MVLGLLLIGAIPSIIGICEAISVQKRQLNEAKRSAKFNLVAACNSTVSRKRKEQVEGKHVVLRGGKLFLDNSAQSLQSLSGHPFSGYYFQYPSEDKFEGLVSTISYDPPMLNWVFIDSETLEIKYGNRTASQNHIFGPWGWTENEEVLIVEEKEAFVMVQQDDESWGLYYDRLGDWSGLPAKGKILDISLRRVLVN